MRVSHEIIYRSLFIQAGGVLKKELVQHLRSERLMRRSVHARTGGKSQGQIVDAISIRDRPAEVEDRAIPGHWEGDLLAGTGNSHIATLVERRSRFTILVKVPSKPVLHRPMETARTIGKFGRRRRYDSGYALVADPVVHRCSSVGTLSLLQLEASEG
jgi:IS30 family transposase